MKEEDPTNPEDIAVRSRGWDWVFNGPSGSQRREVFRWWEERRLRYNMIVGVVGLVTWILVLVAGSAAVRPGVDFEEPLAMIFGPPLYAIFANICYSLGPILDVIAFRGRPRKALFRAGLLFSVFITLVPGLLAVFAWLGSLYTGQKLD